MHEPWVYIVLLGAFAVVSAMALPRKVNPEGNIKQTVRDMETALEQFMESMEADNEDLAKSFTEAQKDWREESLKRENKIIQLERRCSQLEIAVSKLESNYGERVDQLREEIRSLKAHTVSSASDRSADQTEKVHESALPKSQYDGAEHTQSILIKDRYAEIIGLHGQGKSIEYIARKSGLNKGEVQLILQLSRQEEQHLV
ncbi:hypothetical protein AB6A23_11640 [Paenibacillus tarimensis]